MVKTHLGWSPGRDLHALGASLHGAGLVGTKTWTHTPQGATPLLVLFNSDDGSLVAIIEAFALGQLRTSGISAVAADHLADPTADRLGIIGTGKQALGQVAAVAAVRPIKSVQVFSRDPDRRGAFAERVHSALGLAATAVESVEEAVADAGVVTLVTRATEPFLDAAMLRPGTHVNAVGAIAEDRMEFNPAVLDRCGVVAVDSLPQAKKLSRELMEHYGPDEAAWSEVIPLHSLVASHARRPEGADLTLFKALGMGISDVTLGLACLEGARQRELGRHLPHPTRAQPRLRPRDHLAKGSA
jgi:ornithine cyclodeaminase